MLIHMWILHADVYVAAAVKLLYAAVGANDDGVYAVHSFVPNNVSMSEWRIEFLLGNRRKLVIQIERMEDFFFVFCRLQTNKTKMFIVQSYGWSEA